MGGYKTVNIKAKRYFYAIFFSSILLLDMSMSVCKAKFFQERILFY